MSNQHRTSAGIAIIVTTYQRPANLRLVLASISFQRGVTEPLEVVVADDGSTDETQQVVTDFAKSVSFPVEFTTHPHNSFCAARCRNDGVLATSAPYLLFVDGDCVLPGNYLLVHLSHRRPGFAISGDAARLTADQSANLTLDRIATGEFRHLASRAERRRLRLTWLKSHYYRLIGKITKPRLYGGGASIWRDDYLRINGYDQNFVGWGCEDDDLRHRLGMAGVQLKHLPGGIFAAHLWHEKHPTTPEKWSLAGNVNYYMRKGKLRRCTNGIFPRAPQEVTIHLTGAQPETALPVKLPSGYAFSHQSHSSRPDLEVLVWPSAQRYETRADCKVLLNLKPEPASRRVVAQSDYVVGPEEGWAAADKKQLAMHRFEQLVSAIVGRNDDLMREVSPRTAARA